MSGIIHHVIASDWSLKYNGCNNLANANYQYKRWLPLHMSVRILITVLVYIAVILLQKRFQEGISTNIEQLRPRAAHDEKSFIIFPVTPYIIIYSPPPYLSYSVI